MYIDIFAGCGGLSYGLHKARIKGLFAIEKNEDAFDTLKYNLIDKSEHFEWPSWLPIKNYDINQLMVEYEEELIGLRGKVDLVVGGPPCQGFSMAGSRKKDDIRNQLSKSYLNFIGLVEPKFILFENVSGFTVSFSNSDEKDESFSSKLINKLVDMDYDVHAEIVDMSLFGVPQKRKRFILFGTKLGDAKEFFTKLFENREKVLAEKDLCIPICIGEAIKDLEFKNGTTQCEDSKGYLNGVYGRKKSSYIKLMREGLPRKSVPNSHRFVKHREETIRRYENLMGVTSKAVRVTPNNKYGVDLKKRSVIVLKEKAICNTLTSIPDDLLHYSEPRVMTVREYARIQSFPDSFFFKGKYTTGGISRRKEVPRYTQIANAVPPLFAEHVGITLRRLYLSDENDIDSADHGILR